MVGTPEWEGVGQAQDRLRVCSTITDQGRAHLLGTFGGRSVGPGAWRRYPAGSRYAGFRDLHARVCASVCTLEHCVEQLPMALYRLFTFLSSGALGGRGQRAKRGGWNKRVEQVELNVDGYVMCPSCAGR